MNSKTKLMFLIFFLVNSGMVAKAYVTPKMGGGQQNAPMVMPNVLFDGTALSVTGIFDMMGMPVSEIPVLRPLTPPDEFEPGKLWSVLTGTAYNLQYGWNLDATSEFLPVGGNVWIEQTSSSAGLLTFERGTYEPIFGTSGSSNKWMWDGVMAHNAYAVPISVSTWSASYNIYLGDADGDALPGYQGTTLTLDWTSVPEPVSLVCVVCIAAGTMLRRHRRI